MTWATPCPTCGQLVSTQYFSKHRCSAKRIRQMTRKDFNAEVETLNRSWNKLCDQLAVAQDELARLFQENASHDAVEVVKEEIAALKAKLARCERRMERVQCEPVEGV